jgi:hypothetical protein
MAPAARKFFIPGLITLLFCGFLQSPATAQELPASQVWLAPLAEGLPGQPRLISNGGGYNNQPAFSLDGQEVYFTAEQPGRQTDIWRYTIESQQLGAVNGSAESEYSPTPIPGQSAISVIRVEADSRQRLWRIELDSGQDSLLLPAVEPVGYHTWYREDSVALFILGEQFTLHRAQVGDHPSHRLYANIGRTLRRHPGTGEVLFVDKNSEPWEVAAIDMDTGRRRVLMPLFPDGEDFEVDPGGGLWTGLGSKLYRCEPGCTSWSLAAELAPFGIDGITRLAASPDGKWLALVAAP